MVEILYVCWDIRFSSVSIAHTAPLRETQQAGDDRDDVDLTQMYYLSWWRSDVSYEDERKIR